MTLIYIQQRSYHYDFCGIDVSVCRCLYLDVYGNELVHAVMVCINAGDSISKPANYTVQLKSVKYISLALDFAACGSTYFRHVILVTPKA